MTAKTNPYKKTDKKHVRWYETWSFLILVCLIFPLTVRSLLYAPFHIPSSSMVPTLLIGDFILVSKKSYGYSQYSFPFSLPFFDGRIAAEEPLRGDVAVFRPPTTPRTDYIKRIIGLPGDTIQYINSRLYLNGERVPRSRMGDYLDEPGADTPDTGRFIETIPRGDGTFIRYETVDSLVAGSFDNTPVYEVPDGHYFLMGDNRDNSQDSRSKAVGFVPFDHLVGRADKIVLSTEDRIWKFWTWGSAIRGERFWTDVQAFKPRNNPTANHAE